MHAAKPSIVVNGLRGGQSTPKLAESTLIPPCTSLYSVLIVRSSLVLSPCLAYQAMRYRKYIGSLAQRMGYLPVSFNLDGDESIWIHAVSVGEVLTARALLPHLRERYPAPAHLSVDDDADRAADRRAPACRTWTRCSISRSTSASSSTARCGS